MQKEYKTWVIWIFIILTIFFLFICILSIFANLDGLFLKVDEKKIVAYGRYSHIEYLINNKEKYDSILLGGSRIGVIPTDEVEKNINNTKFFNVNYGSGSMKEFYMSIDYLVENTNIKNIILLISPDNMNIGDENLFKTMHYKILKENIVLYYLKRVRILSEIENKSRRIYYNLSGKDDGYFSNEDGTWKYQIVEKKIDKNFKKYYLEEKSFNIQKNEINSIEGKNIEENINYLKNIVNICRKKNVNLTVIMAPLNHNSLVKYNSKDYTKFLKMVAKETNYWDFTGYNSVTINNYNYYEIAHYRYFIGNMMIKRIFSKDKTGIPVDFGEYVTRENINEHIKNREKNIKDYMKKVWNK